METIQTKKINKLLSICSEQNFDPHFVKCALYDSHIHGVVYGAVVMGLLMLLGSSAIDIHRFIKRH